MPTLALAIDASKAKSGAADYSSAAGQVEKSSSMLGKVMEQTKGIIMGFGAALALKSVSDHVIDVFGKYDKALATMRGSLDLTEGQYDMLTESAKRFEAMGKFGADQVLESYSQMIEGGYGVQESMKLMPTLMRGAKLGGEDLAKTFQATAATLEQFGLGSDHAAHLVDVLAVAGRAGRASFGEMGAAMQSIASVAASMGIGIEDAAAALGALGRAGVRGNEAGEGLRRMLLQLTQPSDSAAAALGHIGLTLAQVDPRKVGAVGAFQALAKAHLGAAEAADIFGGREASVALALTRNSGALEAMSEKTRNAAGAADRLAASLQGTLGAALESMKASIVGVWEALGDSGLGKAMAWLFTLIGDTVRVLLGMDDAIKGNATAAKLLAGAVEVVIVGFVALKAFDFVGHFKAIASAFKFLSGAMNAAMLGNPFTLLLAGITTAIALMYTFRKTLGLEEAFWKIEFGWAHFVDVAKLGLLKVELFFVKLGANIQAIFTNLWTNVSNFFENVGKFMAGEETNFKWTSLTDRVAGPLEAKLAGQVADLQKTLGVQWDKFLEDKRNPGGAAAKVQDAITGGSPSARAASQAAATIVGKYEPAAVLQISDRFTGANYAQQAAQMRPMTETAYNTRRMADGIDKLVAGMRAGIARDQTGKPWDIDIAGPNLTIGNTRPGDIAPSR